jgi:HEAT repeat protein
LKKAIMLAAVLVLILVLIGLLLPGRGSGDKIENLIAKLNNPEKSAEDRGFAAIELGDTGDPRAIAPLLQALKDPDSWVRWHAAQALGNSKDTTAVQPLIEALKDEDADVRYYVVKALENIGDPRAIEPFFQALKDPVRTVQNAAKDALRNIKDPEAIPTLIEALKDKDADVRKFAIEALGNIKDPRSVALLLQALKDPDTGYSAKNALIKLKDPTAVPPLIEALNDKDLRYYAIDILGDMGDPRAVEPLAKLLVEEDFSGYRTQAGTSLEKLGWEPTTMEETVYYYVGKQDKEQLLSIWDKTKQILLKDIESDKYLRVHSAVETFIGIGNEEIIPVLIDILNNKGTETMAETYLNCGKDTLRDAAKNWAFENGYTINTIVGSGTVNWGSW